jgi:3-oxoacyl-[acyl-carrier protein] reductase
VELNLRGKVALIAGGSRGLGFAVAKQLAAEGVSVSLGARGEDVFKAASSIEKATGSRAIGHRVDVTEAASIETWISDTVAELKGIDLLCVNTGGPKPGKFLDLTDDHWQQAADLLLLSAVRLVRATLPVMRSAGSGSIVLLTSSAVKEPVANLTLSNVVRASVAALSKSLAVEFAHEGIRVNQLIPGRISTDRVRELDRVNAERSGISVEEQRARSQAAILMGRYGDPEEFGKAATFLLSDAASYITGASLQVDGGLLRGVF